MSTGTMASYEVIILKEGYCNSETGASQMKACGTATLLKGPQNIVVDTGNPWDKDLILQRLSENGVATDDVGYVVCSHGHSDHVGNLNLFPRAIVIVSYDICHGDQYLLHDFEQGIPYEIDEHVEVIATPGHTGADVSVVVKNTEHGTVVLAGDLFECKEDLDEPHIWQQSSENPEIQQHSRLEVLKIADYIVPGHGEMFKVPAKHKSQLSAVLIYEEFSRHDSTSSSVQKAVSYHVFEAE